MNIKHSLNRREFFSYITVGWIAFISSVSMLGAFVFRFINPNVNFEPVQDFIAGKPTDFKDGVDERFKEMYGVWLFKSDGKLVAMSNICTHLGCIPNWQPAEGKFKCPCHGSGYYPNGINFEGPAPRPLERFSITLTPNGDIKIDKTKVFRFEKDQWDNSESYIDV
ncbi:MAG: ubiquinol-cytochrome c reductase iron-sulfur subunit [Bacteriovorax sp.]|nr:ubiquinol-cytochrome c reductase iron-sulfur subunit [Bacteriovorax sp.]